MKEEKIQQIIDIIKTLPVADSASSNETTVSMEEAEKFFKRVINSRIQHCLGQLKDHVKDGVYVDNQGVVVWEGGHFFIPVYEALLEAQEKGLYEWTPLIWQQIVRQMAIEDYAPIYFNIATEFLLCGPM